MNMKSFFFSSLLFASLLASTASASAQEFIVMPPQTNNSSSCQQENCGTDSISSASNSSNSSAVSASSNASGTSSTSGTSGSSNSSSTPNQTPGPSYSNVQIDRSGMDKASIHLQIFQQTAPHLSESNQNKKQSPEDKKSNSKSQNIGSSVTEE